MDNMPSFSREFSFDPQSLLDDPAVNEALNEAVHPPPGDSSGVNVGDQPEQDGNTAVAPPQPLVRALSNFLRTTSFDPVELPQDEVEAILNDYLVDPDVETDTRLVHVEETAPIQDSSPTMQRTLRKRNSQLMHKAAAEAVMAVTNGGPNANGPGMQPAPQELVAPAQTVLEDLITKLRTNAPTGNSGHNHQMIANGVEFLSHTIQEPGYVPKNENHASTIPRAISAPVLPEKRLRHDMWDRPNQPSRQHPDAEALGPSVSHYPQLPAIGPISRNRSGGHASVPMMPMNAQGGHMPPRGSQHHDTMSVGASFSHGVPNEHYPRQASHNQHGEVDSHGRYEEMQHRIMELEKEVQNLRNQLRYTQQENHGLNAERSRLLEDNQRLKEQLSQF